MIHDGGRSKPPSRGRIGLDKLPRARGIEDRAQIMSLGFVFRGKQGRRIGGNNRLKPEVAATANVKSGFYRTKAFYEEVKSKLSVCLKAMDAIDGQVNIIKSMAFLGEIKSTKNFKSKLFDEEQNG